MKDLQWLGADTELNRIHSFGLVIEPKLFTAYFYSDAMADTAVAYKTYPALPTDEFWLDIAELSPLYGVGFDMPWTLLPLEHFETSDSAQYLQFSSEANEETTVKWNELIGAQMAVVYGLPHRWNSFLPALPGIEMRHGTGVLIEYGRILNDQKPGDLTILYFNKNQATLVIFQSGEMRFANSFVFEHLEDIRYFFFYTHHQLAMDASLPVYLFGEAAQAESIKLMLANYLPEVYSHFPSLALPHAEISGAHWLGQNAARCVL